ncbi:MAG: TrbG/VirB9 family P-type conjugative transfer protein [Ehrlichia sp.]
MKPNLTSNNYVGDKTKKIFPTELFDDGRLTYFKFSNNNQIIPQIFTYDDLGKIVPCKMLLLQNYIIIKGVHKNLYLQYKDESVKIINKKTIIKLIMVHYVRRKSKQPKHRN